jgi:hypothetical protein
MSPAVHQWLWPAVVAALTVWNLSYAWSLKWQVRRHQKVSKRAGSPKNEVTPISRSWDSPWSRYFSTGQGQVLQSFLLLGTLLPAIANLAGSAPTIVNAGGKVINYHVTASTYVSNYVETGGANHLLLLARVNADDTATATATVVLYGVNDGGDEGEIGRFSTGANYWTRYERPLITRRIRLIVDYSDKAAKAPNVDLILYLPPGPPAPAATTTSTAVPK